MIRLDDLLPGGRSLQFERSVASGRADSLGDVVAAVQAADEARDRGEWVVLAIAYEAAPAFDAAMRTARRPPDGIPFVWWQSFDRALDAPPPVPVPSPVTERARRANRHPYPTAVHLVRERIARGDVYQVNVTDRFDGRFLGLPLDAYQALVGVQTCSFGAYVEIGERVVASASPELFFRWDGDVVTCRPMKGTAPRHPRAEHDDAVGAALLASVKDRAENVMIVDLLRNDLGRLAEIGTVEVPTLFALERYETVWQLTSTVRARMPQATTLVDVLGALFPCGSVTGAPKIAAMEVIAELEADPRGLYCGAIGLLCPDGAGPRAVFSVPIRTAVLDPATSTFEYGAGAGITWSSDPEAEDAEVRAKARILTRSRRDLALFETMRLDSAGLHHVERHLARLGASARWFGFPFDHPAALAALDGLAPTSAAALDPASVVGLDSAAGLGPASSLEPASVVGLDSAAGLVPASGLGPARGSMVERVRLTLARDGMLVVERLPLDDAPVPVRLAIDDAVTRSDDPFCCHKTTWRRHYDEARARHPDADDVVLVNEYGHVAETTIANIAASIGGRWWCPPLDDGGLAGIARQVAIESGRLAERSLNPADLAAADELAVLNDLRGWRPAVLLP